MLKYILTGWTTLKIIRVGLGLVILYSGVESHSFGGITAGLLFTLFGLLAPGTCCGSSCYSGYDTVKEDISTEVIDYEELDKK